MKDDSLDKYSIVDFVKGAWETIDPNGNWVDTGRRSTGGDVYWKLMNDRYHRKFALLVMDLAVEKKHGLRLKRFAHLRIRTKPQWESIYGQLKDNFTYGNPEAENRTSSNSRNRIESEPIVWTKENIRELLEITYRSRDQIPLRNV